MAYPRRRSPVAAPPMSQMNITPLIDVMLVLLIMFIVVIPLATHALQVPLPTGEGRFDIAATNTVHIDARDRLFWNDQALNSQELLNQLASAAALPEQPLIRFEPDPAASYDRSARTIALIKDAGIDTFAFAGNERYRTFDAE